MILGKVVGDVWSTKKSEKIHALRFLFVQPLGRDLRASGSVFIAADEMGAGEGELVMVTQGAPAMQAITREQPVPVDAVVVGIVALRFVRFPFLMVPVAVALWFMSMDVTPLIYGEQYQEAQGYQMVSLVFGLVMLLGSFVLDHLADRDYAFWGYLFGLLAFWEGLSLFEGGGEIEWFFYGLVNLGLILLSVLMRRKVFIVFGSLGVFWYVGHLAWDIFEYSLLFPFVISAFGLAVIALGILYARHRERVERMVTARVPTSVRRILPRKRIDGEVFRNEGE